MSKINVIVRFDSLTNDEQQRILNTPQYCVCGCGTRFANPVTSKGTIKKFVLGHQLQYIKLLKKPQKPYGPRTARGKHEQKTRRQTKQMKKMKMEIEAMKSFVQDITKKLDVKNLSGGIIKPIPHIDEYVSLPTPPKPEATATKLSASDFIKQQNNNNPLTRTCIKCKSPSTYYNPYTQQVKWYMRDGGWLCSVCYNREWMARKAALNKSASTTTGISLNKVPDIDFTGNEQPKAQNRLQFVNEENKKLKSQLEASHKTVTEQIKMIYDKDVMVQNLKRDVKMLENEITTQLNQTRETLLKRNEQLESLQKKYDHIDQQFGIKYREWEALSNKIHALEALNRESKSQLDRKNEDLKLATDTVVSQYKKAIELEDKVRILQREKDAWVLTCNQNKEKEKLKLEQEKNKAKLDLTFKPVN